MDMFFGKIIKKYNFGYILLLLVLILPGYMALLHPGLFSTDDGNGMVIRFSAFYEAIRNGQFPTRFLPRLNDSYGYPVADFLYPGFMYLGVPIHILGFDFVTSIKIILLCSLLGSGIFCFLWLKKIFGNIAAIIGGVAFVLYPYHLWDIYKRGSVGEVLALAVVPFILWQIERKSFFFTAFGIGFLILAHNTLALLFLPVIIAYMFIRKAFPIKYTILSILFGLAFSSFFWVPALYDKQFTIFDTIAVSNFNQYFFNEQYSYLLNFITSFILLASAVVMIRKKEKEFLIHFFFWITVISVILFLPFSSFLWKLFPLGKFIQFPFRFLSVTSFGIAFLFSYCVAFFTKTLQDSFYFSKGGSKKLWIIYIIVLPISLFVIYLSSYQFFIPQKLEQYPDTFYSTNQDTTTIKNEYTPRWEKVFPTAAPAEKVEITSGKGSIQNVITNGNKIIFEVHVFEKSIIRVNTVYFPGWKVFANKREQKISYNNSYGVMDIFLGKGNYTLESKFTETPIRLFADYMSLISFVSLLIWAFLINKQKRVRIKS